jgi:hypothetical protein
MSGVRKPIEERFAVKYKIEDKGYLTPLSEYKIAKLNNK